MPPRPPARSAAAPLPFRPVSKHPGGSRWHSNRPGLQKDQGKGAQAQQPGADPYSWAQKRSVLVILDLLVAVLDSGFCVFGELVFALLARHSRGGACPAPRATAGGGAIDAVWNISCVAATGTGPFAWPIERGAGSVLAKVSPAQDST